jgi:shikimate kinase
LPPSSCISAVISWFGSSNSIILQTPVLVQLRMICKFIFTVKKQKKKGKSLKTIKRWSKHIFREGCKKYRDINSPHIQDLQDLDFDFSKKMG